MTGRLIAVEGVDASGKTTQARLLADALGAVRTFQFGATEVGAVIRRLLLDSARDDLDDRAEALLIVADKAQHVAEIVAPALRDGRWVVTDRFTASALAYQGHGRGLDLDWLAEVMRFATVGIEPDLNVLLEVPPEVAAQRMAPPPNLFETAAAGRPDGSKGLEGAEQRADRFEAAGGGFFDRVRRGYRSLARADPDRWAVVNGEGSVEEVAARVLTAVKERLAHPTTPATTPQQAASRRPVP